MDEMTKIQIPLKDYYEIVNEFHPLSGFVHAFLIMKLSNFPSFRVIRVLIASQSTFEK